MLVTLAEVKTWLDISGTTEDAKLQALVDAVNAYVGDFVFESAARTEKVDGQDNATVLLSKWPVTAVSTVKVGYVSPTTLGSTDYVFYDHGELKRIDGSDFPAGSQNVEVTYTAGFVTVPNDVKQACRWIVEFWYQTRTYKSINLDSMRPDEQLSLKFRAEEIPREAALILGRYRA